MPAPVVRLQGVSKSYDSHVQDIPAVSEVNLEIHQGELVALMGPSGSGKSTLLNLLGGLDRPSKGRVEITQQLISDMPDKELDAFRLNTIGFVFQHFYLMPNFSVAENVALTAIVRNQRKPEWIDRVTELLSRVDLLDKIDARPDKLSGGQQQRVAVCRALFAEPKVLLADEPTGNLDSKNSDAVLALLRGAVGPGASTAGVLVTHDAEAAAIADRVLLLRDGRIAGEYAPFRAGLDDSDEGEGEAAHAQRIRAWVEASSR